MADVEDLTPLEDAGALKAAKPIAFNHMLNQVFISYRRESESHVKRVRSLAEELRDRGLEVVFDEFYLVTNPGGPDEKWSRWCINQAKESAVVLIVGSQGWYAAFTDPKAASDEGFGAATEANVIQEQLYQQKWVTGRHRIVLLDSADVFGLPVEISGWRRFAPLSSPADMDDLIRWAALRTSLTLPGSYEPQPDWLEQPPHLLWPMANHGPARAEFQLLLTRTAPWRFLPLRGPTETGKSHITKQILGNALQMPDLACGRFDFKGTNNMDVEVRSFVQYLGVSLPPTGQRLNEGLGRILEALKQRARPALLIFDAFEHAGEAQDWVEKQLLASLVREPWLRVVVAGQSVPEIANTPWSSVGRAPLLLRPVPPEEWLAFGQLYKPDITLDFVCKAYECCGGKASILAQLLGPVMVT